MPLSGAILRVSRRIKVFDVQVPKNKKQGVSVKSFFSSCLASST